MYKSSLKTQDVTSNTYRYSNIELLRIVAMVLIVTHHFAYHSGFDFPVSSISINRLWIQLIQIGGKIGTNIFVLITGYFLVSAESVKTAKVIKYWVHVLFYSILCFFCFVISGIEPFAIIKLIKSIAPITFNQWWFASAYFVLYVLSPYINKLLKSLDRKQYIRFLFLLFVFWCIIPTMTHQDFQSNSFLWFVFLYSIAGYYRLYDICPKLSGKQFIFYASLCIFLTFLSVVAFDMLGTKVPFFGKHATYFYGMQKIPIVLISLLLFIGFSRIQIEYSRFINMVSSASFGVYLLHENEYVRPFLWKTVFVNASYAESSMLIPYSLLVIVLVFVCCTIIELIRINLFEKHYMPAITKVSTLLDKKKESLSSDMDRIINKSID